MTAADVAPTNVATQALPLANPLVAPWPQKACTAAVLHLAITSGAGVIGCKSCCCGCGLLLLLLLLSIPHAAANVWLLLPMLLPLLSSGQTFLALGPGRP